MELPTIEQLEQRMAYLVGAMPGRVATSALVGAKAGKLPFELTDQELLKGAADAGNVLRSPVTTEQKLPALMMAILIQIEASRRLHEAENMRQFLIQREALADEASDQEDAADPVS